MQIACHEVSRVGLRGNLQSRAVTRGGGGGGGASAPTLHHEVIMMLGECSTYFVLYRAI